MKGAERKKPVKAPRLVTDLEGEDDASSSDEELHDTPASEIRPGKPEFLWSDRLLRGSLAVLQGEKRAGKSTWARKIVAHVTGGPALPGEERRKRQVGNVLYYAGEESVKNRVTPGLIAAGADMSRVFCSDAHAEGRGRLMLPTDCERLERRVRFRQAQLVVIDPIFAFTDGLVKLEAGTEEARQFTGPLCGLAERTGALVLLTRNLTKGKGRSALDAGRGSGEIGNAARSVLHVQRLPNSDLCGLAVAACNDGEPCPTLVYRIVGKKGAGVIELLDYSDMTADELAAGEEGDLDRHILDRAIKLVKQIITSGEVESSVVRKKAEADMIQVRTLQVAAKKLGVVYRRVGSRDKTLVFWRAPKGGWKL